MVGESKGKPFADASPGWASDERRFKVFISYSRGDSAPHAQRLVEALEERGLAAKLDTRDVQLRWDAHYHHNGQDRWHLDARVATMPTKNLLVETCARRLTGISKLNRDGEFGVIEISNGQKIEVMLLHALASGVAVRIALRPENIGIADPDARNGLRARVRDRRYQGTQTIYETDFCGNRLVAVELGTSARHSVEADVHISLPRKALAIGGQRRMASAAGRACAVAARAMRSRRPPASAKPETCVRSDRGPRTRAGTRVRSQLNVEIKMKLIGMRTQSYRINLPLSLVAEPGFDHILGEHVTTEKKSVIGFEGVERLLKRARG